MLDFLTVHTGRRSKEFLFYELVSLFLVFSKQASYRYAKYLAKIFLTLDLVFLFEYIYIVTCFCQKCNETYKICGMWNY